MSGPTFLQMCYMDFVCFNCLDPGDSRFFLRAEAVSSKADTAGAYFANTFPSLCELMQLNPTFRVKQAEQLASASRLDR
eukprot:8970094-Pyramimonas_sp.AAC.1